MVGVIEIFLIDGIERDGFRIVRQSKRPVASLPIVRLKTEQAEPVGDFEIERFLKVIGRRTETAVDQSVFKRSGEIKISRSQQG